MTFDTILRNGRVVDGTGAPPFAADVALQGERIAALGDLRGRTAIRDIDVSGLVIAPGFIDVHTHDDRIVLLAPEMTPKITQGVTTVITGNCGISAAPVRLTGAVPPPLNLLGQEAELFFGSFAAYLKAVEKAEPAVNLVPLVGHMSLRASVARLEGLATDDEVDAMRLALREAMVAGAFGFSTGLAYPISHDASTAEVIALASEAGRFGGIYTTHMRDEGLGILQSLQESFITAKEARVRLVISHHKCVGSATWGRSNRTLAAIDAAAASQELAFDAYPYTASSTILLPERLESAKETWITWSVPYPGMQGKRVEDIAADWNCTPQEAARRLTPAGAIYVNMDEADVRNILKHRLCMIGSDGLPHDSHPHPRLWGTFPRVLGHYCRDEGLFSLEEAVHRMTGLPAARFGIPDRGRIADGAFADLCVFDPGAIRDVATFADPIRAAEGIAHVFVNGGAVLREGRPTGQRSGRIIRRPGSEKTR